MSVLYLPEFSRSIQTIQKTKCMLKSPQNMQNKTYHIYNWWCHRNKSNALSEYFFPPLSMISCFEIWITGYMLFGSDLWNTFNLQYLVLLYYYSWYIYRITAVLKVETDIIASIASKSDRTSRDTSDNVCGALQNWRY